MNDLFEPLDGREMERLDEFLLNRIPDDMDTDGKDEGIFELSMLDGFLTAMVSAPESLPPSRWLPAIWGDFEQVWESEREMKEIMTLLLRHVNGIAGMLMEQPEEFEPLFLQRDSGGKVHMIVDEWCEGYMRGVALCPAEWNKGGKKIRELLEPIILFGSPEMDKALMKLPENEIEQLQQAITPTVREIHRFWLSRRTATGISTHKVTAGRVKVGRNDPCPCGSGKKFKRCCGSTLKSVH